MTTPYQRHIRDYFSTLDKLLSIGSYFGLWSRESDERAFSLAANFDDGKCGQYSLHRLADGTYLKCTHDFGHEGIHSWQYVDPKTGQIRVKGAIYIET